jgi:pentapeptide MXKDX repeat protein
LRSKICKPRSTERELNSGRFLSIWAAAALVLSCFIPPAHAQDKMGKDKMSAARLSSRKAGKDKLKPAALSKDKMKGNRASADPMKSAAVRGKDPIRGGKVSGDKMKPDKIKPNRN